MSSGYITTVDAVKIWYCVVGDGPTLVVQGGGWGTGSAYLQETVKPLERHFRVVYYDTRGSGRSSRPAMASQVSVGHMVQELEDLGSHLDLSNFALLGHSHGAYIALNYALRHCEYLSSLILIAPQVGVRELLEDVNRNLANLMEIPKYKEAALSWRPKIEPKNDKEFSDWLRKVFPLYFHDPEIGMESWDRMKLDLIARDTGRAVNVSNLRYAVRGRLGEIKIPSLILVGRHDFITSPKQSQMIMNDIKDSQMIVCEKSGHFPWLEEPELVFESIQRFVFKNTVRLSSSVSDNS